MVPIAQLASFVEAQIFFQRAQQLLMRLNDPGNTMLQRFPANLQSKCNISQTEKLIIPI